MHGCWGRGWLGLSYCMCSKKHIFESTAWYFQGMCTSILSLAGAGHDVPRHCPLPSSLDNLAANKVQDQTCVHRVTHCQWMVRVSSPNRPLRLPATVGLLENFRDRANDGAHPGRSSSPLQTLDRHLAWIGLNVPPPLRSTMLQRNLTADVLPPRPDRLCDLI